MYTFDQFLGDTFYDNYDERYRGKFYGQVVGWCHLYYKYKLYSDGDI